MLSDFVVAIERVYQISVTGVPYTKWRETLLSDTPLCIAPLVSVFSPNGFPFRFGNVMSVTRLPWSPPKIRTVVPFVEWVKSLSDGNGGRERES